MQHLRVCTEGWDSSPHRLDSKAHVGPRGEPHFTWFLTSACLPLFPSSLLQPPNPTGGTLTWDRNSTRARGLDGDQD